MQTNRLRIALRITITVALATTVIFLVTHLSKTTPARAVSWQQRNISEAHPESTRGLGEWATAFQEWTSTEIAQERQAELLAQQAVATAYAASHTTTTTSASPLTSSVGTTPTSSGSDTAIWGCIIQHESGGDPTAVNPSSGAGGLFQFEPATWQSNGGTGLPEDASVSEQWSIAEATQAKDGWYPWVGDGCTPVG